ncbi:response regulator [Rubellimicrobium arenae]|uniref:response regulator n=1 Tax=Rubellimicrobium arenae TaxID=2817372 RepID=UPI001B3064AD|nr:response regulator [Rubellimicrobium arenae]
MSELIGKRVLIVEDEPIISMLLEDMIDDLGMTVSARAATLAEARELARVNVCDAAILDINLRGQMSYPAAEILALRGVPLVFVTGYARDQVPPLLANAPVLPKPYQADQIAAALATVLGTRGAPCRPA